MEIPLFPERVAGGFFKKPCLCGGAKRTCIHCMGSGYIITNMTDEEKAIAERKALDYFVSRRYQGD